MTRYLVTTELKTPWYLTVLRVFKLRRPRMEFLIEDMRHSWEDAYWKGQIVYVPLYENAPEGFKYRYYREVKVITKCNKRLVC